MTFPSLGGARITERRHLRRRVRIEAELRVASFRYRVTLIDLSASGYRVECLNRLATGSRATLKLDGFEPMGGTVRWIDGDIAGCAFDRPLHIGVADMLAARYPALAV